MTQMTLNQDQVAKEMQAAILTTGTSRVLQNSYDWMLKSAIAELRDSAGLAPDEPVTIRAARFFLQQLWDTSKHPTSCSTSPGLNLYHSARQQALRILASDYAIDQFIETERTAAKNSTQVVEH